MLAYNCPSKGYLITKWRSLRKSTQYWLAPACVKLNQYRQSRTQMLQIHPKQKLLIIGEMNTLHKVRYKYRLHTNIFIFLYSKCDELFVCCYCNCNGLNAIKPGNPMIIFSSYILIRKKLVFVHYPTISSYLFFLYLWIGYCSNYFTRTALKAYVYTF